MVLLVEHKSNNVCQRRRRRRHSIQRKRARARFDARLSSVSVYRSRCASRFLLAETTTKSAWIRRIAGTKLSPFPCPTASAAAASVQLFIQSTIEHTERMRFVLGGGNSSAQTHKHFGTYYGYVKFCITLQEQHAIPTKNHSLASNNFQYLCVCVCEKVSATRPLNKHRIGKPALWPRVRSDHVAVANSNLISSTRSQGC